MKKKIIIFDMDGVVVDSEPLHENARRMMRERLGIAPRPDFPDPVGASASHYWQQVMDLCGMPGDGAALEQEQYDLVAWQVKENHVPPNPGLTDLLQWVKAKGMKVGLASSSSGPLVREVLELLGVRQYFDCVVTGDDVVNRKPAPDPYLQVLAETCMTAEDAVAVEDSKNGVLSAKNAGIFCFGYEADPNSEQDLSMADAAIRHFSRIRDYL